MRLLLLLLLPSLLLSLALKSPPPTPHRLGRQLAPRYHRVVPFAVLAPSLRPAAPPRRRRPQPWCRPWCRGRRRNWCSLGESAPRTTWPGLPRSWPCGVGLCAVCAHALVCARARAHTVDKAESSCRFCPHRTALSPNLLGGAKESDGSRPTVT